MLKKNNPGQARSLTQQVRSQMLWLGILMFVASIVLLSVFTWRSMESTVNHLVKLEAKSLLRLAVNQPDLILPNEEGFSAYRKWEDIPDKQRRLFSGQPIIPGKLAEAESINAQGELQNLYLLHYSDKTYGDLYVISQHSDSDTAAFASTLFESAINQALWITSIIFLALFFIITWIIRRTTEPLAMLSAWAKDLGNGKHAATNFPIAELNQLAEQLNRGVENLHAYNLREQEFLKHASHELRTPLAIIQASLDTLDLSSDHKAQPYIKRALRASSNITQLSSALLWLARDSELSMPKSEIGVHTFCTEIIDDHRYILDGRNISIDFKANVECLIIENELLSILMANLVRNAFQHSADGVIKIDIQRTGLSIKNLISGTAKDNLNPKMPTTISQGYGLGLQLIQRICHKQNWQFSYTIENKCNLSQQSEINVSIQWIINQ